MWYLIIVGILCILMFNDNKQRGAALGKYIVLIFLLPSLGYGLWQAEKPLVNQEIRYGGKGWNVLKWMAMLHTVMCVVWGFWAIAFTAEQMDQAVGSAARAGTALGAGIGLMMIVSIWFTGLFAFLIIGLFLKKPVTETANNSTEE